MVQESPLITVLVVGLGLAFVFGTIANRLKLSPLVGYLVAGVAVGPFTPGVVIDQRLTLQLADVGVILLMFGVGLHFSLKDLLSVRGLAVPGALLEVVVASVLGIGVAYLLDWPWASGVVLGLALSVASTVVAMRALQERRLMDTDRGRVVVGWLVVQDLLTVLALVMLPSLSDLMKGGGIHAGLFVSVFVTLAKLLAFAALMLVVGRRVIPWILHYIAHTGSRELFRLAVLSVALCVAFIAAELFGVSIALGAFFAGMILSESALSQRAAEESLPLRDAFAVLFFVSVGMVFNPIVLLHDPVALALSVAVVFICAASALGLVRLLKAPLPVALLLGASLAQIGEFSFILADIGIRLHVLPVAARDLILGTSIVTILVNPFLLRGAQRLRERLAPELPKAPQEVRERQEEKLEPTTLTGHVVLVGYGRVGTLVAEGLRAKGVPCLVIEEAEDAYQRLRASGYEFIRGNGAEDRVLAAANLPAARILFVAIPEAFEADQIVEQARRRNPTLPIVARAHFDEQVDQLVKRGATSVVMGEREIAGAMLEHVAAVA